MGKYQLKTTQCESQIALAFTPGRETHSQLWSNSPTHQCSSQCNARIVPCLEFVQPEIFFRECLFTTTLLTGTNSDHSRHASGVSFSENIRNFYLSIFITRQMYQCSWSPKKCGSSHVLSFEASLHHTHQPSPHHHHPTQCSLCRKCEHESLGRISVSVQFLSHSGKMNSQQICQIFRVLK